MGEKGKEKKKGFDAGPLLAEIRDWLIWIGLAVILSFIIGNALNWALGNTTPLVAVMSGSMVHDSSTEQAHYSFLMASGFTRQQIDSFPLKDGFNKGDVIVVKGEKDGNIKVGDVIVFGAPGANYPIIHRVISIQKDNAGKSNYMTKGDHNPASDRWLIPHDKIQGKAVLRVPLLGYVKVLPMEMCTAVGICKGLY
jgi:signal peptidase I